MPNLPSKSVDLIVTDPPYNIKKAVWDKWKRKEDYIAWMGEVLKECERLLKDNGSLYFFHNDFLQMVELQNWINKNTDFVFKQMIVWNKRFNGAKMKPYLDGHVAIDMNRNYKQMAEYCLFYTFQDETGLGKKQPLCFKPYLDYMTSERNKAGLTIKQCNDLTGHISIASHWFWQPEGTQPQPRFIQKVDYEKLQSTGYFQKEYESLRQEYESLRYTFNNQKTHHSVWNYEIAEKQGHVTPKPVPLIENIIYHSSNEGDIAFDPFAGSFTTSIACLNTNRNYICIEKEKQYCDIGRRRIEQWHKEQEGLREGSLF